MDIWISVLGTMVAQLQTPTLAFLIGGMVLAAMGSRLSIPEAIYKFVVVVLLLKVGMGAGLSVREAEVAELIVPALAAAVLGVLIVVMGGWALSSRSGVPAADGYATAGLFGAVSASTLAAGMAMLDADGMAYEGFIGALYPFMDLAALVTAIVLARLHTAPKAAPQPDGTATLTGGGSRFLSSFGEVSIRDILEDTVRSPAISALLLGLAIGVFSEPKVVYDSFYQPLFYGLLSILMLTMGIEAWSRLAELRAVGHIYVLYGIAAPIVNGLLGLGVGVAVHHLTGFSQGGVVLLAVLAASSSDISGPPTIRAALPQANPSAYIGTSTGLGSPVAIMAIPLWMALAEVLVGP